MLTIYPLLDVWAYFVVGALSLLLSIIVTLLQVRQVERQAYARQLQILQQMLHVY